MNRILAIVIPCLCSILIGCSGKKEPNTESTEVSEPLPIKEKEIFSFQKSHIPILKEHLFFYMRENLVRLGPTVLVKYENIEVSGIEFTYQIVMIDPEMISMSSQNQNQYAGFFSFQSENIQLGDTIVISGNINLKEVTQSGVEDQLSSVEIILDAEYRSSFVRNSSYGYGNYERLIDRYDFEEYLIVDLKRPYIFNKSEMYLKARISELTQNDLKGYSGDELAYLRNELFARHGHSFKTEKMKEYFGKQNWYKPYFEDATPFLNDIEKRNAQYIKSLES